MPKTFRFVLYTQEKKVLDEQIESLVIPGEEGYFGILADHMPLIANLGEGTLTVRTGSDSRKMHLAGGFLEVARNSATILADALTTKP